jgi:sterol desaturase/sphingolipid hydroxylase (fatty acid hydroxylase superfamily)
MLGALCNSVAWLVLIAIVMRLVESVNPVQPAQKWLRSGYVTDLIYWLTPYFLYGPLAPKPIAAAFAWGATALTGSSAVGFALVARQPFWAQLIEVFVIGDFLSYWAHRWLHGRTLWPFHAVHHGPAELDWLSTIRNHPVNVVLQRLVLTTPLLLLGFPVATILALAPSSALYDLFTHANLNWRYGPLRFVIVSPVMHRWHHTPGLGCNRNFGEALAIWDVLFGTFYMPAEAPTRLGLDDAPPDDFVGQILWPFRRYAPRSASAGFSPSVRQEPISPSATVSASPPSAAAIAGAGANSNSNFIT